ncbi:MAG: ABC transporter substrate-binding protein [Pseudomonadota bacterium]
MGTKTWLVALPVLILGVLLQSAFWVPTYGSQASGNPARLKTFLRASIVDAKLLNPILQSEIAAQDVMFNHVTEALVYADENGKLLPKLAERWTVAEEAYVAVLSDRKLPDGTPLTARSLFGALEAAWHGAKLGGAETSIQSLEIVPGETRALSETVLIENEKGKKDPVNVDMTVPVPERVKLTLSRVEPQLFKRLEAVLGADYFEHYPFAKQFKLAKPELLPRIQDRFPELLGVGEHNPVITFYVRPGVHWSDGVPMNAADVKFTYEALIDPKNVSPRAASYEAIKSVEVVNDLTVRMAYKRLYAPAILDWLIEIIPKHLLDAAGLAHEMDVRGLPAEARKKFSLRTSIYNREPVGTGPYRLVEWRPDQFIRLQRNEQYWGRKGEFDEIYFRVIPDYLTTELEFQAGALDRYWALPHQAARYRADPNYQVISSAEGYYMYIAYNLRRWQFQDVRVRRALSMAIDVDSIIKYVLSGEGKRSTGPYFTTTPFNDTSVKPVPFDLAGAAALLAEAGYKKNAAGLLEKDGKVLQFTLVTNNANPQRKAVMTVAQDAWRKLGINCKTQAFEWTVFIEDFVENDNFDAFVLGWTGGDINPDLFQIWHSTQTHPYELNYTGYQSARADELMSRIRTEYDSEAQIQLAHELHRVIAEDQPYTFLFEPLKPIVLDKRIVRVRHTAGGAEQLAKITAPPVGDVDQSMTEWRKLSATPHLAAQ